MQFSFGNFNKSGDRATQIEQGVHLDGSLLGSKPAQGNTDKQRSMVVESKAYTVLSRSKPSDSLAYIGRAMWIST